MPANDHINGNSTLVIYKNVTAFIVKNVTGLVLVPAFQNAPIDTGNRATPLKEKTNGKQPFWKTHRAASIGLITTGAVLPFLIGGSLFWMHWRRKARRVAREDPIVEDAPATDSQAVAKEEPAVIVKGALAVAENAPVAANDSSAVVKDAPAVVEETPAVVESAPAVVEEAPAVVEGGEVKEVAK